MATTTPSGSATAVAPPAPVRPLRILVVEDERKVADALREGLEGEGYDVVVETTGEAAFFRLTTDRFDIILLDLRLPGRDGIEILSATRRRGIHTPVVVLTARDTPSRTASSDWTRAPMTTSSSPSRSPSYWRASARWREEGAASTLRG